MTTDRAAHEAVGPIPDDPARCAGCAEALRRGEPRFVFDEQRYHLDCVPAEHAARAKGLLGVKGC
jgi:hypothetical protein